MDKRATDTAAINTAIDQAIVDQRIVGAVVLVAHDGAVAYRRAAGLADREKGLPMREDSIFRLASLTKPIVTAAALRMAELGKLSLTDPVTRYLPDFRPALPDGEVPTITIRHLLTHTAGLSYGFMQKPDGPYLRLGVSDGLAEPGLSMADNIARIVRAGLFYRPGERWAYSVAIDVLGALMEKIEGEDLEAVTNRYVCGPLKLASMRFVPTREQIERFVTGYADGVAMPTRIPDEGQRVHFPGNLPVFEGLAGIALSPARALDPKSFRSGGGGMIGCAGDMLTFIETIRTGGEPIVSRETVSAMMTVQTGTMPLMNPGTAFGFGGSLLVDPKAAMSPQSPGTFAWGGVWGHTWFIDPVRRVSVVSLTNTALEGMIGRYTRDLREAVCATFK